MYSVSAASSYLIDINLKNVFVFLTFNFLVLPVIVIVGFAGLDRARKPLGYTFDGLIHFASALCMPVHFATLAEHVRIMFSWSDPMLLLPVIDTGVREGFFVCLKQFVVRMIE